MVCDVVLTKRPFGASQPTPFAHCDLAPSLRSAGDARDFVAKALSGHPVDGDAISDAVLIVSELVTNAVLHARTELHIGLAEDPDVLLIVVADGHAAFAPDEREHDDDYDQGGRGMTIVAALAEDFGWQRSPQATGKTMWATVALHRHPGGIGVGVDG